MSKIKFWLNTTTSKGYSFNKEELIDLFERKRHNNPSDDELYEFFQDEFDLCDLKELDSFIWFDSEKIVDEQDIKDIDCRMAFDVEPKESKTK